ncbi:MAG: folate-binding protein YgfZ [Gemmatimonadetes bacterium]|nr:folate-binding protein YgfZ [Gemmatimonadota bacterium]
MSPTETTASLTEYRALLESAALLEESDRCVIRIEGDRAEEMLHGLLTNRVKGMQAQRAVYAFMLTPKGRLVAALRLLRLNTGYWLDLPALCQEAVLAHLRKYLPPIFATFESTDIRRIGVVGPLAASALDAWAGEPISLKLATLEARPLEHGDGSWILVRREDVEGPGYDVYVAGDAVRSVLAALEEAIATVGGVAVGRETWEVFRVEHGIPVWAADFDQDNLAQELGQDDRAISFDKGCYTGQEVVARIHFRGHVNRILRGFRLPRPVAAGQPLYEGERERGVITSPAISPRFGPIALGYARFEIPPGAWLSLESGGQTEVEVVALPFEGPSAPPAAPPASPPREERR